MNRHPLVSIITPCYNGEAVLSRLMDSIIVQTYRPIEFILVNDGSTDGTQVLAESYVGRFEEADISFRIITQENLGLGGAINSGLKEFTGDYLCWPDADDYLEPTSVEDRVEVLEERLECAVVSSDAYIRDCNELDQQPKKLSEVMKYLEDPNQFDHHFNGDSIFCSGCHMARASMFLDVNPNREIYPARRGQNWQMLLPMYFKYAWTFLNKPLYNYIKYPNSMSRDADTLDAKLSRYKEEETILAETLAMIELAQHVDLRDYHDSVVGKYAKLRMELAIRYQDSDLFQKEYAKKRKVAGIDLRDRIAYCRNEIPVLNTIWEAVRTAARR